MDLLQVEKKEFANQVIVNSVGGTVSATNSDSGNQLCGIHEKTLDKVSEK